MYFILQHIDRNPFHFAGPFEDPQQAAKMAEANDLITLGLFTESEMEEFKAASEKEEQLMNVMLDSTTDPDIYNSAVRQRKTVEEGMGEITRRAQNRLDKFS